MKYEIISSKNDSKNATRYDALIKVIYNEPAKKQGFWDTIWNGKTPEPPKEAEQKPDQYFAMRISSALPGILLELLLKLIFARFERWKYNPEKKLYSVQLPDYEGFAIIKEADTQTPLADYFKGGGRKKKVKPDIVKEGEIITDNNTKPDPHLL
jgi:hypothetical protein